MRESEKLETDEFPGDGRSKSEKKKKSSPSLTSEKAQVRSPSLPPPSPLPSPSPSPSAAETMAAASAVPSSSSPAPFRSAASTPPGFPVPAAAYDADVSGVSTRFVVASFGDCFLVAATQTGALGTVMRVSRCDGAGIGGGDMETLRLGR